MYKHMCTSVVTYGSVRSTRADFTAIFVPTNFKYTAGSRVRVNQLSSLCLSKANKKPGVTIKSLVYAKCLHKSSAYNARLVLKIQPPAPARGSVSYSKGYFLLARWNTETISNTHARARARIRGFSRSLTAFNLWRYFDINLPDKL